jgi:hypothetical protein
MMRVALVVMSSSEDLYSLIRENDSRRGALRSARENSLCYGNQGRAEQNAAEKTNHSEGWSSKAHNVEVAKHRAGDKERSKQLAFILHIELTSKGKVDPYA